MTTGAKASLPSTQCLRMLSRILAGKWMCRSQRKTMLLASWRPEGGLSPILSSRRARSTSMSSLSKSTRMTLKCESPVRACSSAMSARNWATQRAWFFTGGGWGR
ncbi:hypothetical protein MC885_003698 [Smutsia gigantea]|nr:hypothetical protein MC885_003698 [Smutsia gigantea]